MHSFQPIISIIIFTFINLNEEPNFKSSGLTSSNFGYPVTNKLKQHLTPAWPFCGLMVTSSLWIYFSKTVPISQNLLTGLIYITLQSISFISLRWFGHGKLDSKSFIHIAIPGVLLWTFWNIFFTGRISLSLLTIILGVLRFMQLQSIISMVSVSQFLTLSSLTENRP